MARTWRDRGRADTVSETRLRAARGAAFLDVKKPGWFRAVKITLLEMAQADRCIVGQNYNGFYTRGTEALGLSGHQEVSFGFLASATASEHPCAESISYERLNDAWVEEIRARRKAARG